MKTDALIEFQEFYVPIITLYTYISIYVVEFIHTLYIFFLLLHNVTNFFKLTFHRFRQNDINVFYFGTYAMHTHLFAGG
jgi:hypothetical protein